MKYNGRNISIYKCVSRWIEIVASFFMSVLAHPRETFMEDNFNTGTQGMKTTLWRWYVTLVKRGELYWFFFNVLHKRKVEHKLFKCRRKIQIPKRCMIDWYEIYIFDKVYVQIKLFIKCM